MDNPILLARIGAAHGIGGEVRVKVFGDADALDSYGPLQTGDGRELDIARIRQSKSMLVVKFKGVDSRDEAEALNGVELFVDRSALPDDTGEDEFYVVDLVGCSVTDENGESAGSVIDVANFDAGNLLEISPQTGLGESWYLEFTKANVPQVNLEKRAITIRRPDEVNECDPE